MQSVRDLLTELYRTASERSLALVTHPPARAEHVASLKAEYPGALDELGELLSFSNGIEFFGLTINGLDETNSYGDDLVCFQTWGNGDGDCIVVKAGKEPIGTVVFANHSPDARVPIAASLKDWLTAVVSEARTRDWILHPMDYARKPQTGVYSKVLDGLANTDCELTRSLRGPR